MKTGLVSVTFRQLVSESIIELVVKHGLDGVEWGGDIHVPHGDLAKARGVGERTRAAGLAVAAYGSYYRASTPQPPDHPSFETVLETALALETPTIRVWAGSRGSEDADDAYRAGVVQDLHRIGRMARSAGCAVALEYHGGTLTDSRESVRTLMRELDGSGIDFYWQPPVGWSVEECEDSLAMLVDAGLSNLHVFAWDPKPEGGFARLPLERHAARWERYLALAGRDAQDRWALLEFVRDDDPANLSEDARCLRHLGAVASAG